MNVDRKTFLGLCHQATKLCSFSASKAWKNPDDVAEFMPVDGHAQLRAVMTEDEEHSFTIWEVEGRHIPLLMTSKRLHELHMKATP